MDIDEVEETPEEREETVTPTDRNMKHRKEEPKQKLMTTRCPMRELNHVKRPRLTFNAHKDQHTRMTSPPEEYLKNPDEDAEQPLIAIPVRSSNPMELKLNSVKSQEDLSRTLNPKVKRRLYKRVASQGSETNHMKNDHKDDSSDSEHQVEKIPHCTMEKDGETVMEKKYEDLVETGMKRKYEDLKATVEIEVSTERDAIMEDFTHGDFTAEDKHERREHQTNLNDVPQLINRAQPNPHTDDEEDARVTSQPTHTSLEAERVVPPTTKSPVEQWPTEASEVTKTKENRSLEGHKKTKQDTPDDNYKGGDNEEADGITYTETDVASIGVMASEDNDETGNAHKSDAEAENNHNKIGET